MLLFTFTANAQEAAVQPAIIGDGNLTVPLYKSRILPLETAASRVSVGNPDIADILILRASQIYILGKDLGTTNVFLWDKNDVLIGAVEIVVTHDLQSLKKKLHDLLPNESIEVHSAQRNIILSGKVSNVTNMDAALKVARGYFARFTAVDSTEFEQETGAGTAESSAGEVINLMAIGGIQQVMLEVRSRKSRVQNYVGLTCVSTPSCKGAIAGISVG